jgi:Flp pilus assembly protein TadD
MNSQLASLEAGKRLLLHAISIDKNFADAYALLGEFQSFQAANFVEGAEENLKRAEVAAENAVRINPQSAEGLIALGGIYGEEGREQEAIRALRQAVALAPNNGTAWQMLGYAYYYAGLNELAEQAYRKVVELNPSTPQPHWMHARMLLYIGRLDEADQEMRQLLAKNPDQFKALSYFGSLLYYQGKLDEAKTALERGVQLSGQSSDYTAGIMAGFLYASRKQKERIDPRILQIDPARVIDGDQAYWTGGIYALLGDKQHALEWLKRSVALGNVNYPWYQKDKNYDSLRADPEYQAIMAEVRKRWEVYKNEFDAGR